MTPQPFPPLEAALGTLMLRLMAEGLAASTPPDKMEKLEAVRRALIDMWPDELAEATKRTVWVPADQGGVRAMYLNQSGV